MSFVDLATLTLHRRSELEARINTFVNKCDQSISGINKLKAKAHSFVNELNCDPSQLKDKFLSCMTQVDEFMYLITDFNLAIGKYDITNSTELTPCHDNSSNILVPTVAQIPFNIIDALSDPIPSTSSANQNHTHAEKIRKKKPKQDQLLIAFSSTSGSEENVAQGTNSDVNNLSNQDEDDSDPVVNGVNNISFEESITSSTEVNNIPAQSVLEIDAYYTCCIMHVEVPHFWVITEDTDEVQMFMLDMTSYYMENFKPMRRRDAIYLNYCAFYDEDNDCYYRGLFIKPHEEDSSKAEVYGMDIGELRLAEISQIQPLAPIFCDKPPYARICHLAGLDHLNYDSQEVLTKLQDHLKKYVGMCTIKIDDNTSESLGVYVYDIMDSGKTLNDEILREEWALPVRPPPTVVQPADVHGPPELSDHDLDITECPEYEDPVEAVTGYHNRDEADICKHYKGGPEKTCFKGMRCKKKHIVKHPDGWTLDRVEVAGKLRTLPLPAPGTWHKVLVTCVAHFNRVYVQFVTEQNDEEIPQFGVILPPTTLSSLLRAMNNPAACLNYKPLTISPAPGEMVAALYPLDNCWYRAQVLSTARVDQSVEIIYVDYGTVVWVREDQIRVLEANFMSLPTQAVRCALAGVQQKGHDSKQWAAAKRDLSAMTQDKTLTLHVISRDYDELSVELYDAAGYNVAEQLAAANLIILTEYAVIDDTNVTLKVVVP